MKQISLLFLLLSFNFSALGAHLSEERFTGLIDAFINKEAPREGQEEITFQREGELLHLFTLADLLEKARYLNARVEFLDNEEDRERIQRFRFFLHAIRAQFITRKEHFQQALRDGMLVEEAIQAFLTAVNTELEGEIFEVLEEESLYSFQLALEALSEKYPRPLRPAELDFSQLFYGGGNAHWLNHHANPTPTPDTPHNLGEDEQAEAAGANPAREAPTGDSENLEEETDA